MKRLLVALAAFSSVSIAEAQYYQNRAVAPQPNPFAAAQGVMQYQADLIALKQRAATLAVANGGYLPPVIIAAPQSSGYPLYQAPAPVTVNIGGMPMQLPPELNSPLIRELLGEK